MNTYISLDCESGGLGNQYSLLSVYLRVLDENLNPVDELYLYLKPDDGIYRVCGEAMNVNRIDLKIHDTMAIPCKEAGTKLYKFLKENSDEGKIKLIPVGHGIYGDINWIHYHLIKRETWETFVSYRKLDTSVACQFLKSCGKFPENVSGSLASLVKHFGIEFDENSLHDAKYDTLMTIEVFRKLRELIK